MDFQEIITLISNVGFPIFISLYLIYFMQKEQQETRSAIAELKNAIVALVEKLNNMEAKK